jgi:hypothetical protein
MTSSISDEEVALYREQQRHPGRFVVRLAFYSNVHVRCVHCKRVLEDAEPKLSYQKGIVKTRFHKCLQCHLDLAQEKQVIIIITNIAGCMIWDYVSTMARDGVETKTIEKKGGVTLDGESVRDGETWFMSLAAKLSSLWIWIEVDTLMRQLNRLLRFWYYRTENEYANEARLMTRIRQLVRDNEAAPELVVLKPAK